MSAFTWSRFCSNHNNPARAIFRSCGPVQCSHLPAVAPEVVVAGAVVTGEVMGGGVGVLNAVDNAFFLRKDAVGYCGLLMRNPCT